jgi:hypothetical protein
VEKRGRKNPEVDAARMVALDAIKKNVKVERAERIGRPEVVRRAAMDGAETGKPVDAAFVKPRPEGPTDISRWRKPPDSLHQCYPPWRGGGPRAHIFRPSGAERFPDEIRWLAPPANIHRPSGPNY